MTHSELIDNAARVSGKSVEDFVEMACTYMAHLVIEDYMKDLERLAAMCPSTAWASLAVQETQHLQEVLEAVDGLEFPAALLPFEEARVA